MHYVYKSMFTVFLCINLMSIIHLVSKQIFNFIDLLPGIYMAESLPILVNMALA